MKTYINGFTDMNSMSGASDAGGTDLPEQVKESLDSLQALTGISSTDLAHAIGLDLGNLLHPTQAADSATQLGESGTTHSHSHRHSHHHTHVGVDDSTTASTGTATTWSDADVQELQSSTHWWTHHENGTHDSAATGGDVSTGLTTPPASNAADTAAPGGLDQTIPTTSTTAVSSISSGAGTNTHWWDATGWTHHDGTHDSAGTGGNASTGLTTPPASNTGDNTAPGGSDQTIPNEPTPPVSSTSNDGGNNPPIQPTGNPDTGPTTPPDGSGSGTANAGTPDGGGGSGSQVGGTTNPDPGTGSSGTGSTAESGSSHWLLGVNLSGAEYGDASGVYGTDYTYPTHDEIDYYASKGMDVIRLPFLAEHVQSTADGPLNADELARMDDVVQYAASKGMQVDLDMHNYGTLDGMLVGTSSAANTAFSDLWGKLASHFANDSNVIYGLMNEPNEQSASDWLTGANAAIEAIRQAGAKQEILVPGSYWDGAWTWTSSDNASVMGTGVQDPLHNYAFEVHQYLDSDGSGTSPNVVSSTVGVDRLTDITQWAEATGNKLFLGEFGVASDQTSLTAMDSMLSYMQQHSDVWQGGTYWAGGPWWGDYMYSVEPSASGTDKPQMAVLTSHIGTQA